MALSIGYDIGSSSIKCAVLDVEQGMIVGRGQYPKEEMEIMAPHPGWAEQHPDTWWEHVKTVTKETLSKYGIDGKQVKSIGISYQMHGLVIVDAKGVVLRPSIIWCDSRAVEIGEKAFAKLGAKFSLKHLLNSPGNFTASKLRWVQKTEPEVYRRIAKVMLPGDYIAYKLTGEISSTISGLSEGIFWDFQRNGLSNELLKLYKINPELLPKLNPTFSVQGTIGKGVAQELGVSSEAVVSYRAGDQPNNAFSLNVLNPGEVAATAGTSGVVYGVIGQVRYDKLSRVNQFAHVNHTQQKTRLGVLLCVNGTGSLNSWLRKNAGGGLSYDEMNRRAESAPVGSDGLVVLPFGNGAERVLENKNIGSRFIGLDFNRHTTAHLLRASQEGIVFALKYGMDIMKEMGLRISVIRAGNSNMFLSPLFRRMFSTITGATVELFDTDGAEGAARGAAVGAGIASLNDVFRSLKTIDTIHPDKGEAPALRDAYKRWVEQLESVVT